MIRIGTKTYSKRRKCQTRGKISALAIPLLLNVMKDMQKTISENDKPGWKANIFRKFLSFSLFLNIFALKKKISTKIQFDH